MIPLLWELGALKIVCKYKLLVQEMMFFHLFSLAAVWDTESVNSPFKHQEG